jgi:hypothetical protein
MKNIKKINVKASQSSAEIKTKIVLNPFEFIITSYATDSVLEVSASV